jgi:hypothetical protein
MSELTGADGELIDGVECACCPGGRHDRRLHAAKPDAVLLALKALNEAGRKILPGPIGGKGILSPEWEAFRAALVDAATAIRKAEA